MADIPVNEEQWNAVSKDERDRIVAALRETGALQDGDQIIGDPNVEKLTESTVLQPMWNPIGGIIKGVCKVGCDVAAATAAAWCVANTAGVGLAFCIAATEALREKCRNSC